MPPVRDRAKTSRSRAKGTDSELETRSELYIEPVITTGDRLAYPDYGEFIFRTTAVKRYHVSHAFQSFTWQLNEVFL